MVITVEPLLNANDVTKTTKTASFEIKDDTINEVEQFFVVFGEFGDEVHDSLTCFTTSQGAPCQGRKGATRARITDNDRKFKVMSH